MSVEIEEVTTARAGIFRNAILELFEQELGGNFTGKASLSVGAGLRGQAGGGEGEGGG